MAPTMAASRRSGTASCGRAGISGGPGAGGQPASWEPLLRSACPAASTRHAGCASVATQCPAPRGGWPAAATQRRPPFSSSSRLAPTPLVACSAAETARCSSSWSVSEGADSSCWMLTSTACMRASWAASSASTFSAGSAASCAATGCSCGRADVALMRGAPCESTDLRRKPGARRAGAISQNEVAKEEFQYTPQGHFRLLLA